MKRIKHNDLTHYFLRPHHELPQAYLDSCEKFFRELKNLKLARLTATNVQKKRQASSVKQQASSIEQLDPTIDWNKLTKELTNK
jgi:methionyl-tRNA formyltransferase